MFRGCAHAALTQVLVDETKPGRAFGISATVMAWTVLVVGIVIAVVGAVQAMRTAGEEPAPSGRVRYAGAVPADRAVEDRSRPGARGETGPAPEARGRASRGDAGAPAGRRPVAPKSDVTVAAEGEAGDADAPAPSDAGTETSVAAPEPQAPAPPGPAPEPALPAPMAPSVELLKPTVPAVADFDTGEAGAASSFGVHLASFADRVMAERGWVLFQRNHPAALGDLSPRIQDAKDDSGNPIYLLLAGPFQTQELAAAHCKSIRSQVVFCKARAFLGNELTAVQ